MKEELYTIPVMDGFAENDECAFCAMKRSVNEKNIGFILSPSYMEEDVRDLTNAYGFCREHTEKLYAAKNALGLSLMLESHLMTRRQELTQALREASSGKRAKKGSSALSSLRVKLNECFLCRRNEETMERYFEAFFFLWKKEESFRRTVLESKGFCLEHFLTLYEKASEHLLPAKADEFKKILSELEEKELDRVRDELDWFIKKFDYRYASEPWKNSRDALPRTILKINGQKLD